MIIPKKSLGQHFLHDLNIVKKIIRTAEINPPDEILEIGPGKGILTGQLALACKKVFAIEKDKRLVHFLKKELSHHVNLEVIEGDILKIPFDLFPSSFKIVSNIPYQITSPLFSKLIPARKQIASMTLMLQKEVAERLVAKPGNRLFGPLSVFIQFYADPEICFYIKKNAFSPPPKVESSVVKIVFSQIPKMKVINESYFFKVIKSSFAHRRKSIRNSLKDEGFSHDQLDHAFRKLDFDFTRRAETMTLNEFGILSDVLFQNQ